MKKIFWFLFCAVLLFPLACQKRNRLTSDTLTISIDPSTAQTVLVTNSVALKAICRSAKSDNVDINPSWYLDNGSLGTLSSASGKTISFTGAIPGTTNLYAAYGSIRSAPLTIIVSTGTEPPPPPNSNIYGLYTDTYDSAHNYTAIRFDQPGTDGGCIGKYIGYWDRSLLAKANADPVLLPLNPSNDARDGSESLGCTLPSDTPPNGLPGDHYYGGWWIQFGTDGTPWFNEDARTTKDLSAFYNGWLKFSVKTPVDLKVAIEYGNIGSANKREMYISGWGWNGSDTWQDIRIKIPLALLDLAKIQVPASFHTDQPCTFYIDNVRWDQDL